jgi:hypothetical protein
MSELPQPVPVHQLRVSDAQRERVARVLRDATADGRLDLHELDVRLGAVYAARTVGDLVPLTADLVPAEPAADPTTALATAPEPARPVVAPNRWAVGVLGGFNRRGRWTVPPALQALAFWGGGSLDLREARFMAPVVRIRAFAVMGGIDIVVAEDADVHVTGVGVMGGFDDTATGAGRSGGPTVVVSGFAFWGGVSVRRRPRDDAQQVTDH